MMNETPLAGVIDEVRRALGKSETIAPVPLSDFIETASGMSRGSLVDQFAWEAVAVGAKVTRVSKPELIAAEIEDLCKAAMATDVVISGSQLFAQLSLKWQLEQRGLTTTHVCTLEGLHQNEQIAKLATQQVGVTTVNYAIADTGTVVLTSDEDQALLVSLLPPIHIAVIDARQIQDNLVTVLAALQRDYIDRCRSVTFITGPSRTGDVELTLTVGVHGPKELHLIILEE